MKRRTARTIVVWIALLLLVASWIITYINPLPGTASRGAFNFGGPGGGYDWDQLVLLDSTIIVIAAGFLFTFRGKNDG